MNNINPGLRTTGKRKWLATTVANGQTAVKKLICQSYGMIPPTGPTPARIVIPAVMTMQKTNVNLNLLMSLGISAKNEVSSASFEVVPQDMSRLNM